MDGEEVFGCGGVMLGIVWGWPLTPILAWTLPVSVRHGTLGLDLCLTFLTIFPPHLHHLYSTQGVVPITKNDAHPQHLGILATGLGRLLGR